MKNTLHFPKDRSVFRLHLSCWCWFVFCVFLTLQSCGSDAVPVIDWSAPMYAKLDESQKVLLKEYRDNYVKLKKFYCNAAISATGKMFHFFEENNGNISFFPEGQIPLPTHEWKWEYRSNAAIYFRLDRLANISGSNSSFPNVIVLITPKKSYVLDKRRPEAKYYALSAKRDQLTIDDPTLEDSVFPLAPFGDSGVDLKYLLFQMPHYAATCTIEDISIKHDGEIEKVVLTMKAVPKGGGNVVYHFVFLRQNCWGVEKIEVQLDTEDSVQTTLNTYLPAKHGDIPLLQSSITDVVRTDDRKKRYYRREYLISQIVPGPVPLEEFDVKQFLPPEAGDIGVGIAKATFPAWRIVCIVLGVILLITGIGLQIWKKQR